MKVLTVLVIIGAGMWVWAVPQLRGPVYGHTQVMTTSYQHPVCALNLPPTEIPSRHYFSVAPSAMAHNFHTHVEVVGKIELSQRELDKDWHMRVVDAKGFVTAECIPELPCIHPKVGECVKVRGISRFDGEHKWPEVHPVEYLEVISCR